MAALTGVTVARSGVVGCFIAWRLALEGVPVTFVERQHVGPGASGASAGNVQSVFPRILPERVLQSLTRR
jgi:glycine/D-amino acid oxidase-like deaminating enzyme